MYKNTYAKGENIINIKDITIETGSASKKYDGKPLSNEDDLSIVSGELNDGDYLICDETKSIPSITNAGSIINNLTPKIVDITGEDHTANYNITVNYGTLTVNKRTVALRSESDSKTYDGYYLTKNIVKQLSGSFINNDAYNIKATGKIKNVGSCENTITFDWSENGNPDNYNIIYDIGTLTVNKRPVTLISRDGSYNYTGSYISYPKVTTSGLVDNEVISVEATGKFRDPGTYENKPIVITWADGASPDNYDITYKYGTITISKTPTPPIVIGAAISGQHDNTSGKGTEGKDTGDIDDKTNDDVYGGNEF